MAQAHISVQAGCGPMREIFCWGEGTKYVKNFLIPYKSFSLGHISLNPDLHGHSYSINGIIAQSLDIEEEQQEEVESADLPGQLPSYCTR